MGKKKSNQDKPKTLFDHIKAITQYQDPEYWEKLEKKDKKSWNTYMINRFLSMNPEWTDIVNYVQQYTSSMKDKDVYKLYINLLPKGNIFLRYIKGNKESKYDEWALQLLKDYFEVGHREILTYLDILKTTNNGKNEIRSILMKYGKEKKEIDKFMEVL